MMRRLQRFVMCRQRETNPVRRVVYVGSGVTLSPTLVGVHFHRWPEGNPLSPAPTYGFGTVRSHDYGGLNNPGVRWTSINTADSTYNWTTLDVWVNTHAAAGRKLVYTLHGTPAYLRTSNKNDPYGSMGGSSVPSDAAAGYPALQAFITALVNRYNDGTPEGRKIDVIEAWNEPKFDGLETGFWYGTAPQAVDLARAVKLGIAASVDPGVKVWSLGIVNGLNPGGALDVFLGAQSAAQPGTYGRDWVDEISVHGYGYGGTAQNPYGMADYRLSQIKDTLARYPSIAGIPVNFSEYGGDLTPQPGSQQSTWTPAQWGMFNARNVVYHGLLGIQTVCQYSHDGTLSGDYTLPEFAEPLNRVHTELVGRTITQARILLDGALDLIVDGEAVRL